MDVVSFTLGSPAFADGQTMPLRFVRSEAGGENVSPPLEWTAPPPHTRSLALAVIDMHPVARGFAHWLMCDLPATPGTLAEGASRHALPDVARELASDFGTRGWDGPRPPVGSGVHEYRFTLLALDVDRLALDDDATTAQFEAAAHAHEVCSAHLSAFFGR